MRGGNETRAPAARRGLGRIDLALLLAVAAVVAFVSLPWVEVLAKSDNQADAVAIVRALGKRLRAAPDADLAELVAEDEALAKCFGDIEELEPGGLLRCHGFLFGRADEHGSADAPLLVAWPWRHGRTGTAAFLFTSDGRVLSHANDDGRWQGPDRPPSAPWDAGWVELPH